MELRLTTIVVALAFIGTVTCVPARHQVATQRNQVNTGSNSQEILQLLRQIDAQVKDDVSSETPRQFAELVGRLSQLSHDVISSIDREVRSSSSQWSSKKIENLWNDALIMDASEGSLRLITKQIIDSSVSPARKSYLLMMMPFIERPSAGAVRAVLPLLEDKQVERQTLLSVSALIANARKNNSVPEKELREAVAAIIDYIKRHETSADKVTVALKALHNLHAVADEIALVTKYATDASNAKSVRIAALEGLTDSASDEFVRQKVEKLYHDSQESVEIRIAAYKVLVSHANPQVVKRIVSSLNGEVNKQVGSFVTSHLANLKETSAPRHEEIRRLLSEVVIPVDRFPSDLRKYSRNVELSQHKFGIGAVVDADMIYDQSTAPRSVRFNLSLPLYHREINLVEVSLRQEGLEDEMDKLFSSNGPLAGKDMKEIVSQVTEFFQSSDKSNRVMALRKSIARSSSSSASNVDASMSLKLNGNTVVYIDAADLTESQENLRVIVNKMKQQLSGDWSQDRAFAFKFDRKFQIPSETGLKEISVNGSAVFAFKVDRHGLWPSMAMELSTRSPSKHIIQRVHSSPSLKFVIEGGKITLRFAENKMNILTVSNEAYDIDAQGHETAIVVPTRAYQHCFNGMNSALGINVCASISGPKSLWSEKAPCYAPWTMQLTLVKNDNKMSGWQLAADRSANGRSVRVAFDTPRSSIKRNVAFEFELLDQLTGLRGKIELPRKSMQVTAGYQVQSDKLNGKFEVAVNDNEKYSVEAGLKSKSSGKRVEYMPSLRIEIPKAQPIDLIGTVSLESGRKNSMSFDLRSNAQADRKFIKGTITREGHILKNLKLSTDLQAQIDSVTLRLFSMTDKKEDGSAQTDVKVEYQLPNSRQHNAEFIGKIQNLDQSGESLKMNSFVELKMTQFPEKNVHASWNIQHKPREHLENELTVMWKDQMNDPKRKIHLLHSVKLTGVKSGITATCDNFASIDIAPLNMKYEMKASGHYQRSGAPNHKLSFEVNDKINKNTVAASWEYRHKSLSPLKMSIDASLRVNERAFRYADQIEEISPRTYKGATELQWADSKKANVNYIFKRQSQGKNEVYELTGETKLPSMSLEHSHMMRISPRDIEFNSKMNKQQEKLWDVTGQLTKDDQSSVRFEITGMQGKFNVSPFSVKKTGHFSLNGRSISHSSDVALSPETFTLTSKTSEGKKTLFALNSKMSENVLAGPHDWEIRYAGPTVKSGERKIKIHHEINNGKGQGTVTYYVKNAEQAKFDVYAQGKSVDSKVQLNAGITLKTAQKYHKYDGFNFALAHQHESYANKGMRSASTLNAEFSEEQKVRLTLETAKEGSMRQGKASAKVIIDTPVFDFKHQQAAFDADWSANRARVSMNAQTNENKTLRSEGEFEQKNGRIFARIAGQSEVHAQKHEATFIADKESITVTAKSNDKEVLTTKGKVNYKNGRDFTASLAGKLMSSPDYHGSVEARSAGKKVTYTVAAKKDNQAYATGSMTVDTSAGCAVALRMKLARRNISITLDSQAARDLTNGPHKMTVSVEGDRLPRRSLDMTHQIKENKLRQNVIYTIGQRESFNLKSNVYYVAKNEGRATRHTCDMDIVLTVGGIPYNVKHEGFFTVARKELQFASKAQLQDKNVWQFEGQFGKTGKQLLKFDVAGHSGSMECSPYQENTVARFAIQSERYNHQTDMELNSRAKTLKLSSKAALNNKSLYSLNIVRVPDQENQVALESKWFDCKMKCDPTRSPMTASFVYSGKTKDKTEMKASIALNKDEFKVNAEGKCAYSKKYTCSMTNRRSNSHAEMVLNVEENNRDLLSGHARYETTNGFRGQVTIKKDGKEFISTRAQLAKSTRDGPNEIELTLDSVEQMKLRHEKSNKRDIVTLEHTKSGARRNFAQASAQMEIKGDIVDVQLEFNSDFAKRIGAIKSTSVQLSHRHEMSKRRLNCKSSGKAVINNSPFEFSVETAFDAKSKMTLEMSAQSPIHKFEKQSLSLEGAWNKDSASIASRLVSSAGCGMKLNGKISTDAQRHQSVSGSISIETPKKKFERQEAQFNANWDDSTAQFKLTASDAKSRKLQLAGESEITANKIFARGQTESDFAFIKSSFVEVRADRELGDADVTVKYNGKDILQGKAKGKWSNWNQFDATVQGKARSSPMYTVTMEAKEIASKNRYNLLAKRDGQNVASIEVSRDSSEGNKYTLEASLPLMKTKASMNSAFARDAAYGPHHVQVDFESEKMGAHSATFTHKIQDERVKCAFLYQRDGKTQLNVHHTGSYKFNRAEKKVSMDAEIECKIQKRSYSIHHSGSAKVDRHSVAFESKASYNGKSIWSTEGSLSQSSQSQVAIEAGKRSISLKLNPYGHAKSVDLQYRSPLYTHETYGQVDTKTYEMSIKSKSSKSSNSLIDLQFDRRQSGLARLTLDSVWADARAECDLSKAPMSAHVTLKSKKMRPALDMKMQATADNDHIELNGEYKQSSSAYKGSLRAQRSSDSMFVEVITAKNDKSLYSGRVNAALRADGIKADARVTRKETDLAKVIVALSANLVDGPHQVDISLPGKQEETLRIRHEVLAGTWKASAVHMAKAEKKAYVEVEGKTHGKLSNGDVSFTLIGEKKGKKIMHMSSLQISFNHRHAFTSKSAEVNSLIKAFINRKDNWVARAEGSIDLRSKANLLLELKTPLKDYSEQQVKIESSWEKNAARFEGKFVNSAGKTVTLKRHSAVEAGRLVMKTSLNSQMHQIPSIELDGSVDSRAFSYTANKNGRRWFELSGQVKSAQWNNVDADIQGKYEEGPIYFASVSGKTHNKGGKYDLVTRKNKRDLLGAHATAEINSQNNWSTGIELKSKGEHMASFDLMKGACENGHPQYTAAYSVKDMEKRKSSIHEADVEPIFQTIRSIRGL